nr:MAG: ORF1 [TTV-like mini virus]
MPYYWRRPYYQRRRRRIWRRRFRAPIRRRRYRRRYRVRYKRKLPKIHITEWQPSKINKVKVIGLYPLFEGTNERIGNNNTQYIDSTAPYQYPAGGLFAITVFTLRGLWELHTKARNWWTKSNCNLPLVKYLGCTITLYRSLTADYVMVYSRCGSLTATEELYRSCQPSILTLNKNKRIIQCKQHNNKRRNAKKIFIKPPALMKNQWYMQKDIANFPLLMILSSALSLDRWYIGANAVSSTVGFFSINTDVFEYSAFKPPASTTPYKPNDKYWLFTTGHTTSTWQNATVANLIFLGQTKDFTPGTTVGNSVNAYWSTPSKWGNPFYSPYFDDTSHTILIHSNLEAVKAMQPTDKLQEKNFTEITKPLIHHCRYNPQADKSLHNAVYVSNITTQGNKWGGSSDPKQSADGLPLWLLFFGFHDWLKKSNAVQRLDTDYAFVFISEYVTPQLHWYVPIDYNFTIGRSPYETTDHRKPYDETSWHPKSNFQQSAIASILNTGPGTIKLPDKISTEGHFKYKFHFKFGGCPPPMDNVCDPQDQPNFPTPGNILSPTILQDPEQPVEYYLQAFDQRRQLITEKAAKRLKKYHSTKETIFTPTGTTAMDIQYLPEEETSTDSSSEEEKDKETLQLKLQRHRLRQRKLRDNIRQLLKMLK